LIGVPDLAAGGYGVGTTRAAAGAWSRRRARRRQWGAPRRWHPRRRDGPGFRAGEAV